MPKLAMFLAKTNSVLEDKDIFTKLGDALINSGDSGNARLCYILTRCDLNVIGKRLLQTAQFPHIEATRLGIYYLLRAKDSQTLTDIGSKKCSEDNRMSGALLLIPVFQDYLLQGEVDKSISVMEILLPKSKLRPFIQSLCVDIPALMFYSEAIANYALQLFEESVAIILQILKGGVPLPDIFTSHIQALTGALHVLQLRSTDTDNPQKDLYKNGREILRSVIPKLIDADVEIYQPEFLVNVAKLPEAVPFLEELLLRKVFLGKDFTLTPEPARVDHACMLLLREIYHYRTGNVAGLVEDFETITVHLLGDNFVKVSKLIGNFLNGNPHIHDKIRREASKQFETLKDFTNLDWSSEESKSPPEKISKAIPYDARLSERFVLDYNTEGPDVALLEKDIIGRGFDAKSVPSHPAKDFAEKGYRYVSLSIVANFVTVRVTCCFIMAAYCFYQAMLATQDTHLPEKFAYHGLILKCIKAIKSYGRTSLAPPLIVSFVQRSRLSMIFRANHHLSQVIRTSENRMEATFPELNFLSEDKIQMMAAHWQIVLNVRMLCPFSCSNIYTIQEGELALTSKQQVTSQLIFEKVEADGFTNLTPEYLYRQFLFSEVWAGRVTLPMFAIEGVTSIVEMRSFKLTRAEAMIAMADLHGYDLEDVEMMMDWDVIRRDE